MATTDAYKQSRKDRKKVEVLFAHLKRILKLRRLRLRGLRGERDEFLLAAAAQNLRRLAKWLAPKPNLKAMAAAQSARRVPMAEASIRQTTIWLRATMRRHTRQRFKPSLPTNFADNGLQRLRPKQALAKARETN